MNEDVIVVAAYFLCQNRSAHFIGRMMMLKRHLGSTVGNGDGMGFMIGTAVYSFLVD
jgi:hypothetical protein